LEVGIKTEIHNNSLLGEGKFKTFYLNIGRLMGNFHFSIVPVGTLEYFSSKWSGNFFGGGYGGGRIGQCSV